MRILLITSGMEKQESLTDCPGAEWQLPAEHRTVDAAAVQLRRIFNVEEGMRRVEKIKPAENPIEAEWMIHSEVA